MTKPLLTQKFQKLRAKLSIWLRTWVYEMILDNVIVYTHFRLEIWGCYNWVKGGYAILVDTIVIDIIV